MFRSALVHRCLHPRHRLDNSPRFRSIFPGRMPAGHFASPKMFSTLLSHARTPLPFSFFPGCPSLVASVLSLGDFLTASHIISGGERQSHRPLLFPSKFFHYLVLWSSSPASYTQIFAAGDFRSIDAVTTDKARRKDTSVRRSNPCAVLASFSGLFCCGARAPHARLAAAEARMWQGAGAGAGSKEVVNGRGWW